LIEQAGQIVAIAADSRLGCTQSFACVALVTAFQVELGLSIPHEDR
jgi:hypothetical protein